MANFREYLSGRDKPSRRPTRPVETITVTFTDASSRVYDPKDSIFPVNGQTVETLDGLLLTVDFTVSGGVAEKIVGLEKDTGPDRQRL
ncbi:MAG TPA: hypothetical protein VI588_01995 [Candidatus Gracilibacteria bacterium]|nr:hypothetical protein [Candidatus Gracilibacteria bacterium]